jgi:acetyl-CoA acetyltransferase
MLADLIPATHKALERSSLSIDDSDVYEVNEAFASVAKGGAVQQNHGFVEWSGETER